MKIRLDAEEVETAIEDYVVATLGFNGSVTDIQITRGKNKTVYADVEYEGTETAVANTAVGRVKD